MRESCTYGSMRGSRRKTAKSVLRVAEGRAGVPDNKGRSALLYTPRNGRFTGFSAAPPIGAGDSLAAGSLGVWEVRRETAGGRMRPASDTARRDVSPLLGAVFPVPPHWAGKFGIIYPNRHA